MRLRRLIPLAALALTGCPAWWTPSGPDGMVEIPAASILLGSDDTPGQPHNPVPVPQAPIRRDARISSFWIDRTEVTRTAYQRFLDATDYRPPSVEEPWADDGWTWKDGRFPPGTGDHPVVLVSWYDAREYCAWMGKRLPTEAEWQLAALGPASATRMYPWGQQYDASRLNHGRNQQPNFDDSDGWERTSPVGSFPQGATVAGLQDMYGNAWEWTRDIRAEHWDDYQGHGPAGLQDPHSPAPGLYAAVRGGSYFFDVSMTTVGERNAFLTEIRRKTSGFRCAMGPTQAAG